MKTFRTLPCLIAGVLLTSLSLQAAPYAGGVVVSGGTVTWHLNETVSNGVVSPIYSTMAR